MKVLLQLGWNNPNWTISWDENNKINQFLWINAIYNVNSRLLWLLNFISWLRIQISFFLNNFLSWVDRISDSKLELVTWIGVINFFISLKYGSKILFRVPEIFRRNGTKFHTKFNQHHVSFETHGLYLWTTSLTLTSSACL